ncbi:MAG: MlaD family protein [Balneolales bacterium]|nr:MlaD family protein [Balneolales bacterium]
MNDHTPAVKARLGMFIAIGLAIFVIAIFFIGKQQNLFNPVFKVTTNFNNVSGLLVGNNVRYSGINVGIVDNITIINDSTVQVVMLIRRNVQEFIKSDSQAGIGSEGIIGDRVLIITQGSNAAPTVRDGQHIPSKEPIEPELIIASLYTSAVNAEVITFELAQIMLNANNGEGNIGRILQDTTIAENITQTIANFRRSSEGFDETIEITQRNVFEFMEKLQETAAKTEIASQELGEIMTKINSGQGSLGAIIHDTTMAATFRQTLINVEQATHGLDENMQALKENFFFRRYFRRLEREEQRQIEEDIKLEERRQLEQDKRIEEQRKLEEDLRFEQQRQLDEEARHEEQRKLEEDAQLE